MLKPFKDFAKAYIDDIIIFLKTLEEYLEYLEKVFTLFRQKRISLVPTKSFIGYPLVRLLGQRVNTLGLTTAEDKIKIILEKTFPKFLRDLEIYLGITR